MGGTVVRPAGGVEIVGQAATLIEMPVSLQINGQMKSFAVEPVTVQSVVDELGLKGDRVAVDAEQSYRAARRVVGDAGGVRGPAGDRALCGRGSFARSAHAERSVRLASYRSK